MLFLGESRASHPTGLTETWSEIACADSAGWCRASLGRGAYDLGDKATDTGLKLAASPELARTRGLDGHFEIVHDPAALLPAGAQLLAAYMEAAFDTVWSLGFHFGEQDTIWPLPVYLTDLPAPRLAEYVTAPWGKGHVNLDWDLLAEPVQLHAALTHEVFHCAQDYYDTRPPAQWSTLNRARLWLDEATASWIEERCYAETGREPLGLGGHNVLCSLNGLTRFGHLTDDEFGYGMAPWIKHLAGTQGQARIAAIYQAFAAHGTALDAVLDAVDPPLDWLPDYFFALFGGEIYDTALLADHLYSWALNAALVGGETDEVVTYTNANDLGCGYLQFSVSDARPEPAGSLKAVVVERPADAGPLRLGLYGLSRGAVPVFLAAGVDSLTVGNLPQLAAQYERFLLVSPKSWVGAPDYHEIDSWNVKLELIDGRDLSSFETALVSLRYHAYWAGGGETTWQLLSGSAADGTWSGTTYSAAWDYPDNGMQVTGSLTVSLTADLLGVESWSFANVWDYGGGTANHYAMSGAGGVPRLNASETQLQFGASGVDVCDYVTDVDFWRTSGGEVTQDLVSFGCNESSALTITVRDLR
ncbi:MAG: hypothetical protein R3D98_10420 [Candidatus Krumholzibacteriia bacterium]